MKKNIKKILIVIGILVLCLLGISAYVYSIINTKLDVEKTVYIYIDSSTDYNTLLKNIEQTTNIKNISNFDKVASWLDYNEKLETGKYAITPDMRVLDLVRELRRGLQTPVQLKFNNIRTKEDLAERLSQQIMLSKEDLLTALNNDTICEQLGFNPNTIVAMFIPNTYEVYWDISLDAFLQRMNQEYKKFWNEDRIAKAKEIGLSPIEVSTLASIVEEECTYSDEYPMVAGLYINRLRIGQLLQADPTVKFAVGDFSLKRILNKHLETESPYNTYRHQGLPPGPIRIPSIKGIDSVLNYQKNDCYYMCAKEDFSGRHNFANTHTEHIQNAIRYRKALDARGIK